MSARPWIILPLLALAGMGAWLLARPAGTPPMTPEAVGDGERPPVSPSTAGDGREASPGPASAPLEALLEGPEILPAPAAPLESSLVRLPAASGEGTVTGESLRAALLLVPGLYLRWKSAEAKTAFLEARIRVPPNAYEPRENPAGAHLAVVIAAIRGSGLDISFESPRIVIGARR